MSKFKVGDAVKVVGGPRAGEITQISSPLNPLVCIWYCDRVFGRGPAYSVTIPYDHPNLIERGKDRVIWCLEIWLEHLHDSREKGEWDALTLKLCKRQSEKA